MIGPAHVDPPPQPTFIRGPRKQDQSYVASTWVRQMQRSDPKACRGARFGEVGRMIDAVLERSDTRALIRHAAGDRDAILGWIVYAEGVGVPLVHFVYVRDKHREKGIASALLSAVGIQPTTPYVFTSHGEHSLRLQSKYKAGSHLPLREFLA